jgi:sensor histidine kinase regulating citrate/malate metabolism
MDLEHLHYGQAFRHAAATPLSSLVINLELAQEHRHIAQTPYVQQALCSAYRLKELFKKPQLLNSKHSFFIKPFLKEALRLVKHNSPEVVINSHLNFPQQTKLHGSRFYFQEAIICTLKNAIESYISLSPGENRVILIIGKVSQRQLRLSFTDGGQGMSWLEKSLMFADGYSLKSSGSGTGLTWVKNVVEKHFSGKIEVKSKKHQGTTMTWLIPISSRNRVAHPPHSL